MNSQDFGILIQVGLELLGNAEAKVVNRGTWLSAGGKCTAKEPHRVPGDGNLMLCKNCQLVFVGNAGQKVRAEKVEAVVVLVQRVAEKLENNLAGSK